MRERTIKSSRLCEEKTSLPDGYFRKECCFSISFMIKVFPSEPLVRTRFALISAILMNPIKSWSDSIDLLYRFYRLCSATSFPGTYTALSLPFLLCRPISGHVYCPFFTVFALPLHFQARILPILYRFFPASSFSDTYTALLLPFLH